MCNVLPIQKETGMRTLAAILILTTAGFCQLVEAPAPQRETANLIQPAQPPTSNFVEAAKKPKPVKVVNREFVSHPSHLRMYATALPIEAANAFLAYELKKRGHTKLWRVPFFVAETMHISGIVSNLSPRPGGSFAIF